MRKSVITITANTILTLQGNQRDSWVIIIWKMRLHLLTKLYGGRELDRCYTNYLERSTLTITNSILYKTRMTTFIKSKFKISDDQTNIDKYRLVANITEYHIISKLILQRITINVPVLNIELLRFSQGTYLL